MDLEVWPLEYSQRTYYLRWTVILLDGFVEQEHLDWAHENCSQRFCKSGPRFFAFESRKEALQFKLIFG